MRVISLHDQLADGVPWKGDSRDRVMRDRKTGVDLGEEEKGG